MPALSSSVPGELLCIFHVSHCTHVDVLQHKLVIYRVSPLQGKGANCIEPYAVAQERSRSQGILRYFKKADTVTGKRPREDDDNKTEIPAPDK